MNEMTLTNFNVPLDTRKRFDAICHASGRTRTSVLVELMESYTLSQGKVLADRSERFRQVDRTLQESRQIKGFKEFRFGGEENCWTDTQSLPEPNLTPLSMFYSDGLDAWYC